VNDLLATAVDAHGGMERRNQVKSITVDYELVPEPLIVAIDMGEITIR
jgi:hypothetical protein